MRFFLREICVWCQNQFDICMHRAYNGLKPFQNRPVKRLCLYMAWKGGSHDIA
mgnify:CR=1 FL=1